MKIIGVVARKGGVGKSTIAIHLAEMAARQGHKVALLDLDLQQSCVNWRKRRTDPSVIVVRSCAEQLVEHIELCRSSSMDWIIIDTMPDLDQTARAVCQAAQHVIVPTRPSVMDLESVAGTLALARQVGTPASVLFNLVPSRSKELRGAQRELSRRGCELMPTALTDRVAYRRAVALGKIASDFDAKAARELAQVWSLMQGLVDPKKEVAA